MSAAALVLASLAAALHVGIWVMESLAWRAGWVRAVFRMTPEQADATRDLAFNQGFYNLFLAAVTVAGVVAAARGSDGVGAALLVAGLGSMLAAAVVLVWSGPGRVRPALVQGTLPALALIALAFA